MGGLPLPPHFVGRKPELRALRRSLRDPAVTAAYVRGIGGMGKSSLAAKFLERPGLQPDGVLVIRCNETAALDIPVKLARWLEAQGKAGHAEAAALLLDSRQPTADRTRQAIAAIADRRYVLVFDNFESVMDLTPRHENDASTLSGVELPGATPRPLRVKTSLRGASFAVARDEAKQSHPMQGIASAQTTGLAMTPQKPFSGQEASAGMGESAFPVADPDLAAFFAGLLDARWRGLCLFTGRYRWAGLDAYVGRGAAVELHLPALTMSQAIMLMGDLPRLHREPIGTKIAVYNKVGGHPKSIELLEGWLASGKVTDLLADPSLDGMLAQQWADYFLRALLAQLTAAERDALARLCIFETSLDQEEFDYAEVKPEWVRRWLDLSLVQRAGGGMPDIPLAMLPVWELLPENEKRKLAPPEAYTVHPVVRESLNRPLTTDDRRRLHLWAATYYGRPFLEAARKMARPGAKVTEEQIEAFARGRDGVVGRNVARTDDLAQARAAMARSLEWHGHLFAAGEYEAAKDIVTAVHDILARWGERDRAKALLRGSIETLEGFTKAVAQGNLASLLKEEGKLAEALATYEEVYRTFEAAGAQQQMAAVLSTTAIIYKNQGNYDKAIEYEERSLTLERERDNEEGQAISLHQLSILYMLKEDYAAALTRSQEAEKLARKVNNEALVAATLHEQGLILNELARAATTDDEAATHRAAAVERFQASLAIKRRIGNQAGAADTLGELGKLWMDAGQMREAIAAFTECGEIFRDTNNPAKLGITLECLGIVHERQGQYAAALEKYQQACRIFEQSGPPPEGFGIIDADIARVRGKVSG